MKAPKTIQDSNDKSIIPADKNTPFLYAEESGLALFLNRRTGRKFCMDMEDWVDLSLSVRRDPEPAMSEVISSDVR